MRTKNFTLPVHDAARVGLLMACAALGAPAAALPVLAESHFPAEAPPSPVDPSQELAQLYATQQSRGRPVSDHDHAFDSTRSGENRSFNELMRAAQSRGRGEYLGVEPDIGRNIYRFKFMRPGGNVVWVDVDGRTARVISERE
jgi:hypothetical protein